MKGSHMTRHLFWGCRDLFICKMKNYFCHFSDTAKVHLELQKILCFLLLGKFVHESMHVRDNIQPSWTYDSIIFVGIVLLFTIPTKYNSCFPSVPFNNPIKTSQWPLQLISMHAVTASNETSSAETPIKRRICPWEVNQTPFLSALLIGRPHTTPETGCSLAAALRLDIDPVVCVTLNGESVLLNDKWQIGFQKQIQSFDWFYRSSK